MSVCLSLYLCWMQSSTCHCACQTQSVLSFHLFLRHGVFCFHTLCLKLWSSSFCTICLFLPPASVVLGLQMLLLHLVSDMGSRVECWLSSGSLGQDLDVILSVCFGVLGMLLFTLLSVVSPANYINYILLHGTCCLNIENSTGKGKNISCFVIRYVFCFIYCELWIIEFPVAKSFTRHHLKINTLKYCNCSAFEEEHLKTKTKKQLKLTFRNSLVKRVYTCNYSTWVIKAGGWTIQSQPE